MIIKRKLDIPLSKPVTDAIEELTFIGNTSLIVGGAVRDAILGIKPKDVDIEVYNASYVELEYILQKYGKVDMVGKAFGIILFTDSEGNSYDFSLPRRESKIGIGHKGFDVIVDPSMTPKEAAERRDFTINALAYNPLTEEIHDYFNGLEHIEARILHPTSDKFEEDSLRVLRAMQFQARFGFSLSMPLITRMRRMDLSDLPKERIAEEWMKWATKGKHLDYIFSFLAGSGLYAILEKIMFVPQDAIWHPEGDVHIHVGHVLQAAVDIADRDGLVGDDRAVLIFAALLHDIGKPLCTSRVERDGIERIISPGHEGLGGTMARIFLESIGIKEAIIEKVVPLVENHMVRTQSPNKRMVRRLAKRLQPATITELLRLMEADISGRPPLPKGLPDKAKDLAIIAADLGVETEPEQDIILGRHLIELGLTPGKEFGPILDKMRQDQEEGLFNELEDGIWWLENYLKLNNFIPHTSKEKYDTNN